MDRLVRTSGDGRSAKEPGGYERPRELTSVLFYDAVDIAKCDDSLSLSLLTRAVGWAMGDQPLHCNLAFGRWIIDLSAKDGVQWYGSLDYPIRPTSAISLGVRSLVWTPLEGLRASPTLWLAWVLGARLRTAPLTCVTFVCRMLGIPQRLRLPNQLVRELAWES